MKIGLIAFSLSLLLSAPVSASEQAGQGAGSKAAKAPSAKETVYCFEIEPGTGSRVSRRECHTMRQWEALGVEIAKPGKQ